MTINVSNMATNKITSNRYISLYWYIQISIITDRITFTATYFLFCNTTQYTHQSNKMYLRYRVRAQRLFIRNCRHVKDKPSGMTRNNVRRDTTSDISSKKSQQKKTPSCTNSHNKFISEIYLVLINTSIF